MIPLCVRVGNEEELAWAAQAGADAVVLAPGGLGLAAACGKAKVPVAAVRLELAPPYEAVPPLIPAAAKSGYPARLLVLPPPTPRDSDARSVEGLKAFLRATVSAFASIGEWAESEDLSVVVSSGVGTFFEGSLEITEVIRAARSARVLWAMNTFDADACGDEISGATDLGGDVLGLVIAQDSLDGRRVAPGQGVLPFGRLFEQLEALGYEGPIEVGAPPSDWVAALEALRAAAQ